MSQIEAQALYSALVARGWYATDAVALVLEVARQRRL